MKKPCSGINFLSNLSSTKSCYARPWLLTSGPHGDSVQLKGCGPCSCSMKPGNCGKLNEDLPPAGQPPSGALARNKHQILVHTLRTIFRRCMRRGVVTKKVCPGFQVWGGAKKSIQQRHSNNQSKPNQNQNQNQNQNPPSTPTQGIRSRPRRWGRIDRGAGEAGNRFASSSSNRGCT